MKNNKKKLWKKKNQQKNQIVDTNIIVENSIIPPQHQENSSLSNKKLLHESIQNDYIAQSSSLSKITRLLAGVVIGTIWAICYKEKEVVIPNNWLLISIVSSILFFIIELTHYWTDSIFYHNRSDQIVESGGDFDFEKMMKEVQNNSKKSYRFLNFKAFMALIFSLTFIVGVGMLCYSDDKDKNSNVQQIKQELKSTNIEKVSTKIANK